MFTIRTTKPGKGNKHYIRESSGGYNSCIKGKPTDKHCDVLANCVGYANGRFNEIYAELTNYIGNRYNSLNCNAEQFIGRAEKAGLKISKVPTLGGIMVFQAGDTLKGEDGAGHLFIVEKILETDSKGNPTKIYSSESGYNSSPFWNTTRTNTNGRWGMSSKYKYLGCIENPAVKVEPKPVDKTIKTGDTVIVNGRGTANSAGTGAKTKTYKNTKMKVILIAKTGRNKYALNQYNKGEVGKGKDVTAWFNESDIKKV